MPSRHQHIFLFILLFTALLVYFLNEIAQVNFYYWTFWWYDIMMHFLGGFVVSGVGLWAFVRFTPASYTQIQQMLYVALGTGIVIGISWEFFEYLNGMYVAQTNIVTDTAGDLIMDCIGSITSWLMVRSMLSPNPLSNQSS
ncbi:MAG: hypothetical protein NUW02_00595 [Candidatus Campbellbacteria bacterium]|nr:hypothetical protein [Candidatus Campbellbacteria bacterium]